VDAKSKRAAQARHKVPGKWWRIKEIMGKEKGGTAVPPFENFLGVNKALQD